MYKYTHTHTHTHYTNPSQTLILQLVYWVWVALADQTGMKKRKSEQNEITLNLQWTRHKQCNAASVSWCTPILLDIIYWLQFLPMMVLDWSVAVCILKATRVKTGYYTKIMIHCGLSFRAFSTVVKHCMLEHNVRILVLWNVPTPGWHRLHLSSSTTMWVSVNVKKKGKL